MKEILIDWLDCPDCGQKDALVKTEKGTSRKLYDGDKVMCLECGRDGEVETDGIDAWVI